MDPVSHALIGMAISTAGQGSFDLTNPVTAAATLGAVIPDGDIILKIWGDKLYLKQHRGVSHSLLFVSLEAAVIGGILKIIFGTEPYITLFLWALIGSLSHVFFDLLNSYGAKALWPFIRRKNSLSLIAITDPFVLLFSVLSMIYSYKGLKFDLYILIMFAGYILCKALLRLYGYSILKKEFEDKYEILKIHILPSMIITYRLHYIIETPECKIIGEIDFLQNRIIVIDRFSRVNSSIKECVLKSKTAAYFREFTPIFNISFEKMSTGYKVLLTDLRYMFRNKYLHHATILLDKNMRIVEEKFNPYSMNNSIDV